MKGKMLIQGKGASKGVAVGRVRVVDGDKEKYDKIEPGDIIVADKLRPEHDMYMKKAAAFVSNTGGVTSHGAIIAREYGLPCVVGTQGEGFTATEELKDGDMVEVDGVAGTVHEYIGEAAPPPSPPEAKSPAISKMEEIAASKGIKLDPAFLERLRKRG